MSSVVIQCISFRGVAQLGSASALGAEGRWFESSRPDQNIRRSGIVLGLFFQVLNPDVRNGSIPDVQ